MSSDKKWVTIYRNPLVENPDAKTCVFTVEDKLGHVLGMIHWYGPWRCYSFFPEAGTLFEQQCLRDIADYLDECRNDRRWSYFVGESCADGHHKDCPVYVIFEGHTVLCECKCHTVLPPHGDCACQPRAPCMAHMASAEVRGLRPDPDEERDT